MDDLPSSANPPLVVLLSAWYHPLAERNLMRIGRHILKTEHERESGQDKHFWSACATLWKVDLHLMVSHP